MPLFTSRGFFLFELSTKVDLVFRAGLHLFISIIILSMNSFVCSLLVLVVALALLALSLSERERETLTDSLTHSRFGLLVTLLRTWTAAAGINGLHCQ